MYPWSRQVLCERTEIQSRNLSKWEGGADNLSEVNLYELTNALHLDSSGSGLALDHTVVHSFVLAADLDPLRRVLQSAIAGPVELARVIVGAALQKRSARGLAITAYALRSSNARILISRELSPKSKKNADALIPIHLPLARWWGEAEQSGATLKVGARAFRRIMRHEVVDPREFDRILGRRSIPSWAEVIAVAKRNGLRPEDLLHAIATRSTK